MPTEVTIELVETLSTLKESRQLLNTGDALQIAVNAGNSYRVVMVLNNDEAKLLEDVLVTRVGDDLLLTYATGLEVMLLGFYGEFNVSVFLPGEDGEEKKLDSDSNFSGAEDVVTDGVVYSQGNVVDLLEALSEVSDNNSEGHGTWGAAAAAALFGGYLYDSNHSDSGSPSSAPTTELDEQAPTATVLVATLIANDNAVVQSSEPGTAYLVHDSVTVTSLADITGAVDGLWNSTELTAASIDASIPLVGLQNGSYHLYTVDAAGNLSEQSVGSVNVVSAIISGSVSAGPILANSGLIVAAYDAEGNELGSAVINDDGTYIITIMTDYHGAAIVRVVDTNAEADYLDEATSHGKDLDTDLRAVLILEGEGLYSVNVTPVTELAVRELGLHGGDAGTSEIVGLSTVVEADANAIDAANTLIAQALGLMDENDEELDIVGSTPSLTIDVDGNNNAFADSYGNVLAAISGIESESGKSTNEVLNDLLLAIDADSEGNGSLSADTSAAEDLVSGAIAAEVGDEAIETLAANIDFSRLSTALLAIEAYGNGDGTSPAPITQIEYNQAGFTGVTVNNVAAVNALILAAEEGGANTVSEVKALIQVAALATISAYDGSGVALTLGDYLGAGVVGVSADNLEHVNNRVASESDASAKDSLIEVQALVNEPASGIVSILGTVFQGQELTASHSISDANGLGQITYIWQADGENIEGATQNTYTLTQAEVGKVITLVASYTDGIGSEEALSSVATAMVTDSNDAPTGAVTITSDDNENGTIQGATLTASNTLADVDGLGAITYQWQANGSIIAGAIESTYTLTQNEVGKTITVVARYSDNNGTAEQVVSTATAIVGNLNDVGTITIEGSALEGEALSIAVINDADGISRPVSYQWQADNIDIEGASASSYFLTQNEVGKTITVIASYTDDQGTKESITSAMTAAVVNINDSPTGVISITSDDAENGITQGATLTASHNLADTDGLGQISYQWYADGVAISDASKSTYTLTQNEANKTLNVIASYIDNEGTEESVSSAETAAVTDLIAPLTSITIDSISADNADQKSKDFITNDNDGLLITATLSQVLISGETLRYSNDNGASWIDVSSDVSGIELKLQDDNLTSSATIQLRVEDAAGNKGPMTSQAIVIDTTIDAPVLIINSVQATAIEATAADQFSISVEAGSSVDVYFTDGVKTVIRVIDPATGSMQNIPALSAEEIAGLSDGIISVSAIAIDVAGNVSAVTATEFTLDTTAPVIGGDDSTTLAVSGLDSNVLVYDVNAMDDGANNDTNLTYSLSGSDAVFFVLDAQSGELRFKTGSVPSTMGNYNVTFTATDTAGNESTQALEINLVNLPVLTISDDIEENITNNDVTFTFTFNEAVSGFSASDINITGGTSGAFSIVSETEYTLIVTPTNNIAESTISVEVVADAAISNDSGQGSVAATTSQLYDTLAPVAPAELTLVASDDTGSSDSDGITQQNENLTISGTAEAGTSVELYSGSEFLGTAITSAEGIFNLDISLTASDNAYSIIAIATDNAGNTSVLSLPLNITVDTSSPEITSKSTGAISPLSNLILTFSETVELGNGNITIFKADGEIIEVINQSQITLRPDGIVATIDTNHFEGGQNYYANVDAGLFKDKAGNNVASISGNSGWTFNAANLSTTVAWSGIEVDSSDGYINAAEILMADITGIISNPENATELNIIEIKFISSDGGADYTIDSQLIREVLSIEGNNWTLENNSAWASSANFTNGKTYKVEVKLLGVLDLSFITGAGTSTAEVVIDLVVPNAPILSLSNDSGVNENNSDGLTNDWNVTVSEVSEDENREYSLTKDGTLINEVDDASSYATYMTNAADAVYTLTVIDTDAANNSTSSAALNFTLDTAMPTIVSSTSGAISPIANLEAVFTEGIFKGTGNVVIKNSNGDLFETISITDSRIEIGGTDNKTLTINPSSDLVSGNSYFVEIDQGALIDVAGNEFIGISSDSAWTFNAASLSTTVVWSGTEVDSSDGYINADELSVTNISGVISNLANVIGVTVSEIKFISQDGGVDYTVDSSLIGSAIVIENNSWTLVNDGAWASSTNFTDGKIYKVQVKLLGTLAASEVNGSGIALGVMIDTQSPIAPNASLTVDSGSNASDGITNSGLIAIPSNKEEGATVEYRVQKDGTTFSSWNSTYMPPVTDGTADGVYKVEVRQIDSANNISATQTINFTLDTTEPVTTNASLSTDSGSNTSDNITNSGAITAPTNTETDASVEYRVQKDDGSFSTWNSNYTAPVTDGTADGVYLVEVRQTDAQENISATQSINFILDSTAPTIPSINNVSIDDLINANEHAAGFTLTGTGEVDARVAVSGFETAVIKETTVDENGNWSIAITDLDLAGNGSNTLTVIQTDMAGNVSSETTKTITTDLVAPVTPTIHNVSTDNLINISENASGFDLTGTGEIGAKITVSGFETGIANKNTTVDENGDWSIVITSPDLADNGSNTLTVIQTDIAGNESSAASKKIVVDLVAPTTTTINNISTDDLINATENSAGFDLTGTGEVGAKITVSGFETGIADKEATIDVNGNWSIAITSPDLANNGSNTLTVMQADMAGNKSPEVRKIIATDLIAPEVPTINSISTDDLINASENAAGFDLTGTGEIGAKITVSGFETGIPNKNTTVDKNGDWSIAIVDADLADNGSNTLSAIATDPAGNESPAAIKIITTYSSFPTASIVGDDIDGGGYGTNDTITLKFSHAIDVSLINLILLNAGLSSDHSFGTVANGASITASDASTLVITLGSDATVDVNDSITIPQASAIDASGNTATADIILVVPIPSSGPTAALTDSVSVNDTDTSGGYTAGDIITVRFSTSVMIANLTPDQFTVLGKTLGTGAMVTPTDGDATFATTFVITLGANPTITAGEQISVDKAKVVDTTARTAANDITFTLADITPPAVSNTNTILADDTDISGGFTVRDTLTITFDEAVNINSLTTNVTTAFSVVGKSLGTNFSVAAVGGANGFSTHFQITLGANTDIVAADSLVVKKDRVEDNSGNTPTANLIFSIPDVVVPDVASANPIVITDTDVNDAYGESDVITLHFNKPILIAGLLLADFSIGGEAFSATAVLSTGAESPAGYTTEFIITLGAGSDIHQGDQISVDGTKVVDSTGTSAVSNIVFTLPDITPPSATGNAVPTDDGSTAGSYDESDTLTINFSEGIQASELTNADLGTSINLSGTGTTFGTDATILATNLDDNGLATQFKITLGAGTDVASGDTITVNADQIKDGADNSPDTAQNFSVPAVSVPTITGITIPADNYESGDAIVVTVNFSELVNVDLHNGTMTLKLDVGGSEVLAEYTAGSGSSALSFTYHASGAIDSNGITVQANAINKNVATIRNAANEEAELTQAKETFPDVTVDAPFSVATAAAVWLDGMDVDGDGDTTDQQVNDVVSTWKDKSGKGNDVSSSAGSKRAKIVNDDGKLSVRFDQGDYLVNNNPDLDGATSTSTFVVTKLININRWNTVFTTRSNADGIYIRGRMDTTIYDAYGVAQFSPGGNHNGTKLEFMWDEATTPETDIIGHSIVSGQSRTKFLNGVQESVEVLSEFVPGTALSVGAISNGLFDSKQNIKEILHYDRALNEAETIVVQNYLSSKWETKLATDADYYSGDTADKGDYDYYVTGILNLSNSNIASGKQGALTISNSDSDGFLKDVGDAVFLGNKGLGYVNTDLPNGIANVRSNTVWYLDATDAATLGGNIDLSFDLSKLEIEETGNVDDYVLLWRSSTSGQFYQIATADGMTDNNINFNNLNVNTLAADGTIQTSMDLIKDGYITIGVKDNIAPEYQSITVDGNTLTLTFDENLNANSVPDTSAFSVDIAGNRTVTNVVVSGKNVVLTFDGSAVLDGDTVRVNYTEPTSGAVLEDTQSNDSTDLSNVFVGTSGVNTLIGTSGADIIVGNQGVDTLTGGAGSDIFDYNSITDDSDTITDFTFADEDKLDLSDLLEGYISGSSTLADFLTVDDSNNSAGGDVTIAIDFNGDNSGADLTLTLQGLGTMDGSVDLDTLESYLILG